MNISELFGGLCDLFDDPVLLLDDTHTILLANQQARDYLGLKRICERESTTRCSLERVLAEPLHKVRNWLRLAQQSRSVTPGRMTLLVGGAPVDVAVEGASLRLADHPPMIYLRVLRRRSPIRKFEQLNRQIELLNREIAHRRLMEEQLIRSQRELEALNLRLLHQTTVDGLTGVTNRSTFNALFEKEWANARRAEDAVGVLLMDIDHFKAYNDTYGHLDGDHCLIQVATAIRSCVDQSSAAVARYGGEEFVVMLLRADLDRAVSTAVALIDTVESLAIPHRKSPTAKHVTISVGVALAMPGASGSHLRLLQRADDALYEAKARGRNQFVLAAQPVSLLQDGNHR